MILTRFHKISSRVRVEQRPHSHIIRASTALCFKSTQGVRRRSRSHTRHCLQDADAALRKGRISAADSPWAAVLCGGVWSTDGLFCPNTRWWSHVYIVYIGVYIWVLIGRERPTPFESQTTWPGQISDHVIRSGHPWLKPQQRFSTKMCPLQVELGNARTVLSPVLVSPPTADTDE